MVDGGGMEGVDGGQVPGSEVKKMVLWVGLVVVESGVMDGCNRLRVKGARLGRTFSL